MAIPTDYIFISGTCTKAEVFQLIIDRLTTAGWADVSSSSSTDFVVMKSSANTDDKELILNIRDTSSTNANSIVTTDMCVMSYRLQDTYTPGDGVAGVFGRPALAWSNLYIAPVASPTVQLGKDTVLNYHVYADKSKLILVLEYPEPTGYSPVVIYLGQPDSLFVSDSASRGVLVAVSCQSSAGTATSAHICNTSDTVASVTTPYAIALSALLPTGDPNVANKTMVSSIYYGSAAESFRGKLDGLKVAFYNAGAANMLTGDTVTVNLPGGGTHTYYVVITAVQSASSFPSRAILLRTA